METFWSFGFLVYQEVIVLWLRAWHNYEICSKDRYATMQMGNMGKEIGNLHNA